MAGITAGRNAEVGKNTNDMSPIGRTIGVTGTGPDMWFTVHIRDITPIRVTGTIRVTGEAAR